jgi:uncharacterized membrane protein
LGKKFPELSIYANAQLKSKKLFHEESQIPLGVKISLFLCFGLFIFNFLFSTGFFNIITLLVLLLIQFFYPKKKTLAGAEFKHDAKCYKEFLKTAKKDQINWEERQKIFESHLPFAIALGLTKQWNSIFEGSITLPAWYISNQKNHDFNFTRDIDSFSHSFQSQSRPPQQTSASSGRSGFSSGGSSGGGHGGGGGSSW